MGRQLWHFLHFLAWAAFFQILSGKKSNGQKSPEAKNQMGQKAQEAEIFFFWLFGHPCQNVAVFFYLSEINTITLESGGA